MSYKRPLTRSELDLWHRATADVQPLDDVVAKKRVLESSATQSGPPVTNAGRKNARISQTALRKPAPPQATRALDPTRPVDIDRRTWERLKKGQIAIERTLDLHGRTQTEAHGALNRFLAMASATGLRCILVVTGKGGGEGRGILRQMVPRWLDEATHRQHVLTYCGAQPRHGGDGALYILLRRRRGHDRR